MTAWHGVTLDARSAAMMDEVARLCDGIIITPTQGSWSGADASAGTHAGAGAIDIAAVNLPQSHRDKIVYEMRRVGWAAWHRTPAQSDWPHHIHGIACAEPGLSNAARDQEQDYYAGRNGLASNAPDDGPRDFVGVTWEKYQAQKDPAPEPPVEEPDMILIGNQKDGKVHLVGLTGPAYIASVGAMNEIVKALQTPGHIASVDDQTFQNMVGAGGS